MMLDEMLEMEMMKDETTKVMKKERERVPKNLCKTLVLKTTSSPSLVRTSAPVPVDVCQGFLPCTSTPHNCFQYLKH